MAKTIMVVTVTGDPLVTGAIALKRGASLGTATPVFETTASGGGLLTYLASIDTPALKTTAVLDGMVGISFDQGETSDELFLTKDGAAIPGVTISAATSSGTVSRSRSDASAAGFVAGVAIGIAMAQ